MNDFDRGFVIGLIVGEGCFTGDLNYPCLAVKLHERDPEPLQYAQRLLGGRIYGPYNHGGRHYSTWNLRGRNLRSAIPWLKKFMPPCWKRVQFEKWLEEWEM